MLGERTRVVIFQFWDLCKDGRRMTIVMADCLQLHYIVRLISHVVTWVHNAQFNNGEMEMKHSFFFQFTFDEETFVVGSKGQFVD